MINRRQVLGAATAATLFGRIAQAEGFPADLKITRIVSFDLPTRRSKYVGKNAKRGDHGQNSRDRMVRLYTNMGVEGLARCWRPKEALEPLLGQNPFKIKIGRGFKWMDRKDGDTRDVEVVATIRKHAGEDVHLGVDANNGYDLAIAKRFLQRSAEFHLDFIEEPFPERVEPCLELKAFIAENGWGTMLADGEGTDDVEAYRPLVDAKALDVLQGDMYGLGIEVRRRSGRLRSVLVRGSV